MRANQFILKEISPKYSLERLMLKLKLQYFGHLMRRTDSLEKTLMLGKVGGRRRGGDRGWDGWMASPTQWTWVWVGSGRWWWTGRPGMLQSMGLQRVGHNWAIELMKILESKIATISENLPLKNEILPFVATWIHLEGIMLNETSQTEKQILYYITYMWNWKNNRLVNIAKQKETHRCRDTSGYQWEEGRGVIGNREEETPTFRYKINYTVQIGKTANIL